MFPGSPRVWAFLELSQDLFFHRISPQQRIFYIDAALEEGRRAVEQCLGRNIQELYAQNSIAIMREDHPPKFFGVAFRAQIELGGSHCLTLYRSSIEDLARSSGGGVFSPLGPEQAETLILAHEYFHYLEYQGRPVYQKLPPLRYDLLYFWKRCVFIRRCSEIAAHAFAQKFLSLSLFPTAYDYLYLIDTSKVSLSRLGEIYQAAELSLAGVT